MKYKDEVRNHSPIDDDMGSPAVGKKGSLASTSSASTGYTYDADCSTAEMERHQGSSTASAPMRTLGRTSPSRTRGVKFRGRYLLPHYLFEEPVPDSYTFSGSLLTYAARGLEPPFDAYQWNPSASRL